MSLRTSTIVWLVFVAFGFVSLCMLKYKVQAVKQEVARVERQLMEEKKNLHVLEAEWSYLARPERLAQLSAKYLQLSTLDGKQLASYSSLPIINPTTIVMNKAAEKVKTADKPVQGAIALASGAGHER